MTVLDSSADLASPVAPAVPDPVRRPSEPALILILGLLAAFGPLAIDMYLPAFPAIAADLATTSSAVGWTLAVYFVGLSAGQLVIGPLTDRVGRTRPLHAGIAVFVAGSLLAAAAPSIELVVAARAVQSLGGAACVVIARAVVRDLYRGRDAARVNSRLVLVMGVAPIVAPLVGGWLLALAGWRSIFAVLAVLGGAAYAAVRFALPETRARSAAGAGGGPAGRRTGALAAMVSDRGFVTYAAISAVASAGLFAYITGAPALFMELHRVPSGEFGWYFGGNACGYVLMSQLNARLVGAARPQVVLAAGLCSLVGSSLALVIGALTGASLWLVAPGCFGFLASLGLVMPNAMALALEDQGPRAGQAAATIGALQFGLAAAASGVVSSRYDHSALPMTTTMLALAATAGLILTARAWRRR